MTFMAFHGDGAVRFQPVEALFAKAGVAVKTAIAANGGRPPKKPPSGPSWA